MSKGLTLSWTRTIHVTPMGKPRMTRRDKWAGRKCVNQFWAFKDELRKQAEGHPEDPHIVSWNAYFPVPKSWSKKKKDAHRGEMMQQKPDRDNVDKAILDSLFADDSRIAGGWIFSWWDDGQGPRIELDMLYEEEE